MDRPGLNALTLRRVICATLALALVEVPTMSLADAPSPEVQRAEQRARAAHRRAAHSRAARRPAVRHQTRRPSVVRPAAPAAPQPVQVAQPVYKAPSVQAPQVPVYRPPVAPVATAPVTPPPAAPVATPAVSRSSGFGSGALLALLTAVVGGGAVALTGGPKDTPTSP